MSEFSIFSWILTVAVAIALLALFHSPRSSQRDIPSTRLSSKAQFQRETFEQLQTLLVNYPSAAHMAIQNPHLPARNLVALFTPLEHLIHQWGYESIGQPWQAVVFDPQLHQPDQLDIQPGETVYVRFIGYRNGDEILCPAKVSRTLPQISNPQS
ncbi:MAG: molecular chaperone GrpE [Synechococcales cyanobacterium T60_A2020_003]|nr:molecular chaperone GrpE [Synechococcales cyanobacterium T60_A2020_003]